jgi:hypothetical protein
MTTDYLQKITGARLVFLYFIDDRIYHVFQLADGKFWTMFILDDMELLDFSGLRP